MSHQTCHTDFPRIGKYSNGRSGKIERETGTESAEYLPVRGPKKPSREIGVTGLWMLPHDDSIRRWRRTGGPMIFAQRSCLRLSSTFQVVRASVR